MEVFGCQCVAEFFLRRQINTRLTHTKLLSTLKYKESQSPDSLKLKISSVLRDISSFLIRGTLGERMLDFLEMLEKLLLQQHPLLLESHKSAYYWTAVECTLIFMWPLIASDGFFTDAFERIWKKRVGNLKKNGSKLVTHDLLKWKTDLKKALEDPEVYQRIRETNVRYTSISFLNQLLKEQWTLLESSSLESVAQRMMLLNVEGDVVVDNSGEPNAVEDENGNNRENADNVKEVGCLENNSIDKVNEAEEEDEMGAEEHKRSLNKRDETAVQELKDLLLKVQRHIDLSTSQGQQPDNALDHSEDVTVQSSQVNRTQKAKPHVRRLNKFWTPEEVEALREGVTEYGKSWKYIKNSNPSVFMERTEVDLKDKWRNLIGRY